jgi:hypothetical protein
MTTIGRAAPLLSALLVMLWTGWAQAGCPDGDLTGDCVVDAADLRLLAELWLISTSETVADLNRDMHVDGEDLALLADDWGRRGCPIVINEILAHSHADAPDWIELHNISSVPVDIGGWSLSDSAGNRDKFVIDPGTVVDPFGYIVFYENTHFGNALNPGTRTPFALSENGETLCLSSSPNNMFGECLLEEAFGASETDHSFGRYRKSTDTVNFVTMSVPTPGEGNAYPLVGPVVINEVMYHPAGDGDAEYVELLNVSGVAITLFDFMAVEPWRFVDESGIEFWFPADPPVTLRADEHLLLVKDASEVAIYGVPPAAQVFEWGAGKLANEGEKLQLLKPGDVDEVGTRYWIEVDRLSYSDGSRGDGASDGVDPWPIEADGLGRSLNRLFPSRYGNDPNNWHATIPTPGATND